MNNIAPRTSKAMFIIGALFFVFGFVTWVNSTLIPYLKIACELETSEAVLVTFAFLYFLRGDGVSLFMGVEEDRI